MIRHEEPGFFPPLNVRFLLSLISLSSALAALWEAAKLGCFVVHDVLCARLLPTLGAGVGIMRSGLPGLGSSSHIMTWSARQRPLYSVGGEPEDGDDANGDDFGVCAPRHGSATDCHAGCEAFYYT